MSIFRSALRCRVSTAALLCAAIGAVSVVQADAQTAQRDILRGTLSQDAGTTGTEQAPSADASTAGLPSQAYTPLSSGAVPPAASDGAVDDGQQATTRSSTVTPDSDDAPKDISAPPQTSDQSAAAAAPGDTNIARPDADGSELRIRRIDTLEQGANERAQVSNLRTGAIERTPRRRDEEPFAPLGLRVGTFKLFPQFEQGITSTNNADQSPTGTSALLSESTLRLRAESDWSRHQASVEAFGTLRKTLSGQEVTDFQGSFNSDLRLDITSSLRGLASLDYSVFPEDASSPVSIAGVDTRPLHHVIEGSLGAQKDVGKLRLSIIGDLTRDQYGDAKLDDGTTLSQDDRNATLASLRLRTGYEISPALSPFVEGEVGRRFYDRTRDTAGYERSANHLAARAGVALDLREKLTGELSAGWVQETPDDDRLKAISGPGIAASLIWSPVRETSVRLDGTTTVEGTTTPGETGSILYTGLLTMQRQMRADLTGTAALGLGYRTYDTGGHDTLASAELGLTWWMNRYTGITGRARYELLRSDLADRDYDAASAFLGLTVQR